MYEHRLHAVSDHGDYHYSGEYIIENDVRIPHGPGIKVTTQGEVIVVEIGFWVRGELVYDNRFGENRLAHFVRLEIAGPQEHHEHIEHEVDL